jgi:hypothetical protein
VAEPGVRGALLVIFGPPAVGKMTIAREVCDRSEFRLFLNLMYTEPGVTTPADALLGRHRHLRIDTETLAPDAAAELIAAWLRN